MLKVGDKVRAVKGLPYSDKIGTVEEISEDKYWVVKGTPIGVRYDFENETIYLMNPIKVTSVIVHFEEQELIKQE